MSRHIDDVNLRAELWRRVQLWAMRIEDYAFVRRQKAQQR